MEAAWEKYSKLKKPVDAAYEEFKRLRKEHAEAVLYEKIRRQVVRDLVNSAGQSK